MENGKNTYFPLFLYHLRTNARPPSLLLTTIMISRISAAASATDFLFSRPPTPV